MRYAVIILCLMAVMQVKGQTILLTPVLPPSAFQNQFYQVRFRVRNMVGARFEFRNLPSFFTASSEGQISGVPTKQGLYTVEVVYFNETYKESKEVIMEVRRGTKLTNYNGGGGENQQSVGVLKPKQEYLFTYNENDQLNIQVNITNGEAPYAFESIYLPQEMTFNNKTGSISGAFRKYGEYVLGIKVRDSRKAQIQVLIKVTIVIKNTTVPKFIFYQRSLLQIKFQVSKVSGSNSSMLAGGNNNTPVANTSQNQLKNNLTGTNPSPGGSINLPSTNQANSSSSLPNLNNTANSNKTNLNNQTPNNSKLQNPTSNPSNSSLNPSNPTQFNSPSSSSSSSPSSSSSTTKPTKPPSTSPIIPQSISSSAQSPGPKQLISTQNILNKNITTQITPQQIQKQKDRLNKKLNKSKQDLTTCYNNVQTMRKNVQNYLNLYNQQMMKVDKLRDELQELKTKSQRASIDLEEKLGKLRTLELEKILAQRQMNRSQLSFDNVNFAYNGSLTNINKNLQQITNLQTQIDSYNRDLDNSYKTLDQAMTLNSKLQDQKLQVRDGIKKGLGLFTLVNSTKTHKFGGCQNYKFNQKSIGVGQVKRVIDKIYLLTNNMIITFGECTQKQEAKQGDIIEWKGYLQNGAVSALKINKLK